MRCDLGVQFEGRPARRLLLAFCILIGFAGLQLVPGRSVVHADSYTDDVSTVARVDAHEFGSGHPSLTQLSGSREEFASPAVEARAASTTCRRSVVATNKVAATGDDLLKPGPWATESVPSSAPGKITQAERDLLNPIGDASGCHSCGAPTSGTKSGNWIGDHQPVSRTVTPGTPQVLHCQACSNNQGLWIINLIRQGKLQ